MVPSKRLLTPFVSLLALLSLAGVAAAQTPPETPQLSPLLRLTIALAVNGVLGLLIVAFAPDYTQALVDDIRDDPAVAFVWGLIAAIGGLIALVILAITIIGLFVGIPVAFVVALVGGVVGMVALGEVLADRVTDASLHLGLGVGVVVSSLLSLVPILGGVVNFVVGTLGIGAVVNRYWTKRQENKGNDRQRPADSGGASDV
ncbi:hypothetical protein SAMN04487949_2686 [Halogranum gelatinilyticum]|uniref:DUF8173 domain-containing protein n=1 Tax=Halogranum gelatinilyticum TaxID=660521 RepID=A0A1G9WBN2_9EURY|nr:hypothetical protein [Halogranum gelatinilyticum]SDM81683.1 hypothetical protein SAMN04487949_2686 [Halogranum gelatinilyticum]